MSEVIEGQMTAQGRSFGIVVSRFNEYITQHLLDGALKELLRHGVREDDVSITWVPGAFEIPHAILGMARTERFHALIALGAIIRGATSHYEHLSQAVAKGLAEAQIKAQIPVAFGVITTDTVEQAIERAGTKHENKGRQAARSAIEMSDLDHQLKSSSRAGRYA